MAHPLAGAIAEATGAAVKETEPLAVGFGLTGLKAVLGDGRTVAVKAGKLPRAGHLRVEGGMLRDLEQLSNLPVPRVHHASDELLIMDWIGNDGGPVTPSVERHAAELLADLHTRPFIRFGYKQDTIIGPLPQPNPETQAWIPFFRDHRLLHMARAAYEENSLPAEFMRRLEALASRLGDYLAEPAYPALIHGDMWTGNVLIRDRRIAGFVDPAIYCAHPEIELAFTTMFGTFGHAFFDAYKTLAPLEPGFHEVRRDLYNLYPTLVHVRLFGASYLGGIDRTLRRLGF